MASTSHATRSVSFVLEIGCDQNASPLYPKFHLLTLIDLDKFEAANFVHYPVSQSLSPNLNNYFTLVKFSNSRQTRTTASSNLIIPLLQNKKNVTDN